MTYAEAEKRRRRRTGGSGASFGIFKCFRPTVDDDVAVHKAEDAGPASAAEKMAPLPPPFPVQAEEIRIDKKGRRGILAAIKALFFETSLVSSNCFTNHNFLRQNHVLCPCS